MYAIVEIAGQQFKVEEGRKIFVHKLGQVEGTDVEFDKVLLIEDGDRVIIGEPHIKDALVEGKVIDNVRGDKVIVFKKKRRKGYQKSNGHRQSFSHIEITAIHEKADNRKPKKAIAKEEASATTNADAEVAAIKKPAARKAPAKKTVAEKPEMAATAAVKKTAAEKPSGEKTPAKKTTAAKPSEKKAPAKKPAAKKNEKE